MCNVKETNTMISVTLISVSPGKFTVSKTLQYPKVDANTRPFCYATGWEHKGLRRHYRNFLPPINFLVYWFCFLGSTQKSLEKNK